MQTLEFTGCNEAVVHEKVHADRIAEILRLYTELSPCEKAKVRKLLRT